MARRPVTRATRCSSGRTRRSRAARRRSPGSWRSRAGGHQRYPEAAFELTGPQGYEQVTAEETGDLAIHSETDDATFQRTGNGFRVNRSTPVAVDDHGIDAPNFGGIAKEDEEAVGFLLTFAPT
ncbi:hypothetical protein WB401_08035 [Streptomyces brasiliscabiei]|uniref:Uncharacterized protein n=1 Tax=Streptomyces brasiliscabiei TaxID=2736302 RepID=A0ABU8G3Q4_9ACTN